MKIKLTIVPLEHSHTAYSKRRTRHLMKTTYLVKRGKETIFWIDPVSTTKGARECARKRAEAIVAAVNGVGGL